MRSRNSLNELHDFKAEIKQEIKRQGYGTSYAALRSRSMVAMVSSISDDENEPQLNEKDRQEEKGLSTSHHSIFSKLKTTVADLHVPSILSLAPRKGRDLLEDFPSNNKCSKKEPFWKSMSLSRHHKGNTAEKKRQMAATIAKAQAIHDTSDHNMACAAYCDSEEFCVERTTATQQRRLSDSLSVLETCNAPLSIIPKATSDDFLSYLLDSELPSSTDLNLSSATLLSAGDLSVGDDSTGRRRSEIRASIVGNDAKQSRRRSSKLLELDNTQHYGGLSPFAPL